MLTAYIKYRTNLTIAEETVPYRADYFGHKLHMDHDEKLGMYAVTLVAAVDEHSRMIVYWTTIPLVKNNLLIYSDFYR